METRKYFIGDRVFAAYVREGSAGVFEGRIRSVDIDPTGRVIYEIGSLGFFFPHSLFPEKSLAEEYLPRASEIAKGLSDLRAKMGQPGMDEAKLKSDWESITEEAYGKPEFPELAKK